MEDTTWLVTIVDVLINQLTTNNHDDGEAAATQPSNKQLAFTLHKTLKILSFLETLCDESDLKSEIVDKVKYILPKLVDYQVQYNFIGVGSLPHQPEWSEIGVGVIIASMSLMLALKGHCSELAVKLHKTLQDSQISPFLASAITSTDQTRVFCTIQLLKETIHLPEFADLLLAHTITSINNTNPNLKMKSSSSLSPLAGRKQRTTPDHLYSSTCSNGGGGDVMPKKKKKNDIRALIDVIHDRGNVGDGDDDRAVAVVDNRVPELVEMYENKLSMFTVKQKQLEELLDARTTALTRADELIVISRQQASSDEYHMNQMKNLYKKLQESYDDLVTQFYSSKQKIALVKKDLTAAVEENTGLQEVAAQYDLLQSSYNEQMHKIKVLDRNLLSSKAEYQSLKELNDMVQKQKDKMKDQLEQTTTKLEEIEKERLKLIKRSNDYVTSISSLEALLENQQTLNSKIEEEKQEAEQSVKELREKISSQLEELKQINYKLSSSDSDRQLAEHKLKELTSDHRKINNKYETIKNKLKKHDEEAKEKLKFSNEKINELETSVKEQKTELKTKDKQIREQERQIKEQENNQVKMKKKFETQAQTLKMITQLSSELQNSQ